MPATTLTNERIAAATTGLQALYLEAYSGYKPDYERLAMRVESRNQSESYNWLGGAPRMQIWNAERGLTNLNQFNFSITNNNYEGSLLIHKNDIIFDKLGNIKPRIQELALMAKQHPGILIHQAIRDGASTACYDGQNYFSTTHSENASGTQSNLLTGTGTSLAQIKTDYASVIAAMGLFKDDRGQIIGGIFPDVVMVPPALYLTFREAAQNTLISNSDNVLKGMFDVVINSELTDTNDWYAFDTKHAVKPYVYQVVEEPGNLKILDDPVNNERMFMRGEIICGVDGIFNVGGAQWRYAVKVSNA